MADESAPKPGHFLPGGAGDAAKSGAADPGPANPESPKPGHFLPGGAGVAPAPERKPTVPAESTPLTAPTPRIGSSANAPAGPPQLSGSRLGPPPPGDPAAAAFKARFSPDPVPFVPRKRSKGLIAAIVVGALLVVGGGVAAAAKLLSSYDDIVANPLGPPSLKSTESPTDDPATADPTSEPIPDSVVEKENKLYAVGKLAGGCKEPGYRPTSKESVRSYYQVLLTCMNKAWEPVVKKAGYSFHPPKLIIFDDGQETACGVQKKVSSYCDADGGSVAMPWQSIVDDYPKNKPLGRIDLADNLGYVYGVHVQKLTGIFDAASNLSDAAPNEAYRLEHDRRQALQAGCLSAVFLGADKAAFPIQGDLLKWWQWRTKHNGDELSDDKVRDHGSNKSVELWTGRGFSTGDPGSCNTFAAAVNKVS
jgi:predicted metalloprotease